MFLSFVKVNVQDVCSGGHHDSVACKLSLCVNVQVVNGANIFDASKGRERVLVYNFDKATIRAADGDMIFANVLGTGQVMRVLRVGLHLIDDIAIGVIQKLQISPRSPMSNHELLASTIKGQAFSADKDSINGPDGMRSSDVPNLKSVVPARGHEFVRVQGVVSNTKYPICVAVDFARTETFLKQGRDLQRLLVEKLDMAVVETDGNDVRERIVA